MRWIPLVVAIALGCGDQNEAPCSIPCDDGCPGGTTCSVGFCAAAGDTCDPEFAAVTAGGGFACALDQFGRAWCWGANADRQIADDPRPAFTRATVASSRRWDAIAAGAGHACALDGDELWCWGRNDRNQVTSAVVGDVATPVRIEVDGTTVSWSRVSTGFDYTCAITGQIAVGGKLFCWGAGDFGKLGVGSPNDAPRPQVIASDIADWIDVAAGQRHTCAISKSLGVWCWGDGSSGQLGNTKFNVKQEPQSAGLIGATRIAVGLDSTCAVTGAGELSCWGRVAQGALGDPLVIDPTGDNVAVPTIASTLTGWVEVASAERFTCGRREDEVFCWGTAKAGGLGTGRWQQTRRFAKVTGGASGLAVGWNATDADPGRDEGDLDLACAIVDGAIQCWGDNRTGQLAQGGATRSDTPLPIAGDQAWDSLHAGASHVCGGAIVDGTAQRDVYCWGSIEVGQVAGVEAGRTTPCSADVCDVAVPRPVPAAIGNLFATTIATGANHTCIQSGSDVACWGDSRLGQTGAQAARPVAPTLVPGVWDRVFAGANATCGVEITGAPQITCWGEALESHPPEADPELAGATELAFGFDFGCQLDATDTLACFGNNANGVFGNGAVGTCGDGMCNADETGASCTADCGPAPLTDTGRTYQAIAIGRSGFACGLRADLRIECWGDNIDGQCGSFELSTVFEPNMIANATDCTQLAAGRSHACAVCGLTEPAIVCWGDARHGEVGPPASVDPAFSGRPIPPPAGERWASVTAGDGFTCGTTESGHGFCWGTNLHGALGTGVRGANLPVAITLEGGE